MNAIEFIEFHYLPSDVQAMALEHLGIPVILPDYKLDMQRFKQERKFAEFLKREFKPEMILWFEGTEYINYPNKEYILNYENRILGICFTEQNRELTYNLNMFHPSTLADFLSDCRRAGIVLTFKKGCANG